MEWLFHNQYSLERFQQSRNKGREEIVIKLKDQQTFPDRRTLSVGGIGRLLRLAADDVLLLKGIQINQIIQKTHDKDAFSSTILTGLSSIRTESGLQKTGLPNVLADILLVVVVEVFVVVLPAVGLSIRYSATS